MIRINHFFHRMWVALLSTLQKHIPSLFFNLLDVLNIPYIKFLYIAGLLFTFFDFEIKYLVSVSQRKNIYYGFWSYRYYSRLNWMQNSNMMAECYGRGKIFTSWQLESNQFSNWSLPSNSTLTLNMSVNPVMSMTSLDQIIFENNSVLDVRDFMGYFRSKHNTCYLSLSNTARHSMCLFN